VRAAFHRTLHPYTAGLLASLPKLGDRGERLRVVPGNVPDPTNFPKCCRFHPRCPIAQDRCRQEAPPLEVFEGTHQVRCWRAAEIAAGTLDPVAGGSAS
jgi:oligopeptide/dipeptide ABC transporter ATP-binding protein